MKLRIYRNSIRFRLSPAEVVALQKTGQVREITQIAPEKQLAYCLKISSEIPQPAATLDAATITIHLPSAAAREWAQGQDIGIRHMQSLGSGQSLEILIEKDFACLDPAMNEEGVELYPNPNKACAPD